MHASTRTSLSADTLYGYVEENGEEGSSKKNSQSLLRLMREKQKLSQRELARTVNIPRSHLQRIEAKPHSALALAELELIAEGLNVPLIQLIQTISGYENPRYELFRVHYEQPPVTRQLSNGVQLAIFYEAANGLEIGEISIAPGVSVTLPARAQIALDFYMNRSGMISVSYIGRDYVFREKECFGILSGPPYELYNSHQIYPFKAFLLRLPQQESQ